MPRLVQLPLKKTYLQLRGKLFFGSLSLLIIPWMGFLYFQEMKLYLQTNQELKLQERANVIAEVLRGQPRLFYQYFTSSAQQQVSHLFIRQLKSPINIDGYDDDWRVYRDRWLTLRPDPSKTDNAIKDKVRVDYQLGVLEPYMYGIFRIYDKSVIYHDPNDADPLSSDHLVVSMFHSKHDWLRYYITTVAPGGVMAKYATEDQGGDTVWAMNRDISGEWQETSYGYNIELKIPTNLVANQISFDVVDVDDEKKREVMTRLSVPLSSLSGLINPMEANMRALLERLSEPGMRIWLMDSEQRIIDLFGQLSNDDVAQALMPASDMAEFNMSSNMLNVFYRFLLKQPVLEFQDDLSQASRLQGPAINMALTGVASAHWRETPDQRVNILRVAQPIYFNEAIVGVVAIEKTSNRILALQNRAIEILINISVIAFSVAMITLLMIAARLSQRIRKLRNEINAAITPDGQVIGGLTTTNNRDELGDLSRSFADILRRLSQYNLYLESMSEKLAHELRTPITVVQSSLDNLDAIDIHSEGEKYVKRAREGAIRLHNIVKRMGEATRLEQSLQHETPVIFNIVEVIQGCVEGYQMVYVNCQFRLQLPAKAVTETLLINGAPDLIAQLLDKLIVNAIDFHREQTAIVIRLSKQPKQVMLAVLNEGAHLPEEMHSHLFNSMVSVRQTSQAEPHLGLGLYIVRLITEFHQGKVAAHNRSDVAGAEFRVYFPLAK